MHPQPKMLHWSVAASAAFAAHLLVIMGYMGLDSYGAAGEGQGGIEIGLGLLGDMGESLETSDASGEIGLPRKPPPPESPLPERSQPESARTFAESESSQQAAEIQVRAETAEPVQEAAVQTEPVEQAAEIPPVEPATGAQATMLPGGGGASEDAVTRRRQSSGAGDTRRAGGAIGRKASYWMALAAQVNRYKHYPMAARRARQEGTATLTLVILRDGTVKDFHISKSSGWEALDAAVLRMLDRAQPLPAFPSSMTEDEIRVEFPVSFSLQSL